MRGDDAKRLCEELDAVALRLDAVGSIEEIVLAHHLAEDAFEDGTNIAKKLKYEFLAANPRVCATVLEDKGYRHGDCAHAYRSVVLHGPMERIEELEAKKNAMQVLLEHQEKDPAAARERFLAEDTAYDRVVMLKLTIESMTGKEGS